MAKSKKKQSPVEEFLALSDKEKEAVVAEFDKEFVGDTFKPLTPAMRKQWQRVQRQLPGRPKIGQGAKRVLITVEGGLLKKADHLAKEKGLNRSQLFSEGIRKLMKTG